MLSPNAAFLIAAAALLSAAGCSSSSGLVPVSGKVIYKGQPVAGATIVFMGGENTRPATAVSQPDGSFNLMTLDAKGAAPGEYTVVVTKTDAPAASAEPPSMEEAAKSANRPPPPPKDLLPAKYGDPTKTPLKFTVKPGERNHFDLQLAD